MGVNLTIDREQIAAFCRRHQIRKLALFGSVLREDFRSDSDVDVLVEFEPDRLPTLFDMVDMENELTELLGRKADLRTAEDLSRYFRRRVLETAKVQYLAG